MHWLNVKTECSPLHRYGVNCKAYKTRYIKKNGMSRVFLSHPQSHSSQIQDTAGASIFSSPLLENAPSLFCVAMVPRTSLVFYVWNVKAGFTRTDWAIVCLGACGLCTWQPFSTLWRSPVGPGSHTMSQGRSSVWPAGHRDGITFYYIALQELNI